MYRRHPVRRSLVVCVWISHITHMNESCHTHEWAISHTWMSHDTHEITTHCSLPAHVCSVCVCCVCTVSACVFCLDVCFVCIYVFAGTFCFFAHAPGLPCIHVRDMIYSCVWHDIFVCVSWHILLRDVTHSYVWCDSLYVWHDYLLEPLAGFRLIVCFILIWTCTRTHMNGSYHTCTNMNGSSHAYTTNESCHTHDVWRYHFSSSAWQAVDSLCN